MHPSIRQTINGILQTTRLVDFTNSEIWPPRKLACRLRTTCSCSLVTSLRGSCRWISCASSGANQAERAVANATEEANVLLAELAQKQVVKALAAYHHRGAIYTGPFFRFRRLVSIPTLAIQLQILSVFEKIFKIKSWYFYIIRDLFCNYSELLHQFWQYSAQFRRISRQVGNVLKRS